MRTLSDQESRRTEGAPRRGKRNVKLLIPFAQRMCTRRGAGGDRKAPCSRPQARNPAFHARSAVQRAQPNREPGIPKGHCPLGRFPKGSALWSRPQARNPAPHARSVVQRVQANREPGIPKGHCPLGRFPKGGALWSRPQARNPASHARSAVQRVQANREPGFERVEDPSRVPRAEPLAGCRGSAPAGFQGQSPWPGAGAVPLPGFQRAEPFGAPRAKRCARKIKHAI